MTSSHYFNVVECEDAIATGYNDRDELVSADRDMLVVSDCEYAYQYDDIGNRLSSLDLGERRECASNNLNQYVSIAESDDNFVPQFDLDGNQTLVKTSTGVWSVTYNAENRPVLWECGSTNIVMSFDRMGRRVEYVEMVNGVTNTHHRFVYDGYVCIQRLNAASNNSIDLVFGWDPSEPVATRPLVLQKYGQYNLFYTHDGNKNVSELVFFQQANGIAAHYEYAPFGTVTATSRNTPVTDYDFREYNPFRFSSEYFDSTLDSVCYRVRYLNMIEGRWTSRDPGEEVFSVNLHRFINNTPLTATDWLGLDDCRKSNSDFNLNWEFKGLGGAIGSFTISYHRKIEQTVCNIRCSDCRAGYTVERTVTDGAGAGMSWELPITGLPSVLKVPLSVSYNMSGGEHYFYNSCTKMDKGISCPAYRNVPLHIGVRMSFFRCHGCL